MQVLVRGIRNNSALIELRLAENGHSIPNGFSATSYSPDSIFPIILFDHLQRVFVMLAVGMMMKKTQPV